MEFTILIVTIVCLLYAIIEAQIREELRREMAGGTNNDTSTATNNYKHNSNKYDKYDNYNIYDIYSNYNITPGLR